MTAEMSEVDRIGELLFGRGLRLRVGLFLTRRTEELTFQGELAVAVGCSSTEAGKELERFAAAGLLLQLPRPRKNDRRNYLRTDHPLWQVFQAAADGLSAADTTQPRLDRSVE